MNYVKNKSTLVVGDILVKAEDIFIIKDIDLNDGIVYMQHQNNHKIYMTSYKHLHINHKFYDPESETICKISNM